MEESDFDKPIYRIMPIHRLLEDLQKMHLNLVKPKKWDDPFENLLLSIPLKNKNVGNIFTVRADVYGMCWTLRRETDAMWRIYSPDKQGAKVKTTPRKLLDALKKHDPEYWQVRCFIGKVEYVKQKKLRSSLEEIRLLDSNGSGIPKSLLLKRREFQHEKEVRLIYCPASESSCDIHPFKISPNELFEEVIFDPRMDKELVNAYTLAIKEKKYQNPVAQSKLYQLPNDLKFISI
ncbi:MAG: DUF2971 domain-containing protein [Deltaproteobacteria bacterium]|nr:DUF2971 domain-containing protein [Deltaproteobacteria bacterium]